MRRLLIGEMAWTWGFHCTMQQQSEVLVLNVKQLGGREGGLAFSISLHRELSSMSISDSHLYLKDQRIPPLYLMPSSRVPISQTRGYGELPLLPDAHAHEAAVPALDDLADTEGEGEGGGTVERGVELLTRCVYSALVGGGGEGGGGRWELGRASRGSYDVHPTLRVLMAHLCSA